MKADATLTRVEAEQVARYVTEHHDRLGAGLKIGRYANGRLRLEPADGPILPTRPPR